MHRVRAPPVTPVHLRHPSQPADGAVLGHGSPGQPWWRARPSARCHDAIVHCLRRFLLVPPTVLSCLLAAGCGSPGGDPALRVATRFYDAVAMHDGARACRYLAPQTRHELESSAGAPCARALLGKDIPSVRGEGEVRRFGNQAAVTLTGDTVFLAEFDAGWRVVAAACTPRGALPYDCQVKGV